MAISTGTVNAPPSGTNPILISSATVGGNTGDAQMIAIVDPDSASNRVASITANGLKVDGSAVTQPVSISGSLPAGSAAIGSVSVSNFPSNYGPGANSTATSGQFVAVADSYVPISVSANGVTQLIAGVTGKSIRVTGFDFIANSSGTVQFVQGASNTAVTGAYPVSAETGISRGTGYGAIWVLPAGAALSISLASGGSAYGSVSYTVY